MMTIKYEIGKKHPYYNNRFRLIAVRVFGDAKRKIKRPRIQ